MAAFAAASTLPILEPAGATPQPDPLPVWLPPQVSEVHVQPAAPIEAPAPEAFWHASLRDQQDLPTLVTAEAALESASWEVASEPTDVRPVAAVPAIERPSVVIHEPQPQSIPAVPAAETASARPQRPRAVVRTPGTDRAVVSSAVVLAPLAAQAAADTSGARSDAPELVMAAPVEMWFGDSRVGVKQGTRTYEQFRRYADVLFDDLRAADKA